jgi:hypothetical protein
MTQSIINVNLYHFNTVDTLHFIRVFNILTIFIKNFINPFGEQELVEKAVL